MIAKGSNTLGFLCLTLQRKYGIIYIVNKKEVIMMYDIYINGCLVGYEEKMENAKKLCEYNNLIEKENQSNNYWHYNINYDIDEALEFVLDFKKIQKKNGIYSLDNIFLFKEKEKDFRYEIKLDLLSCAVLVDFETVPFNKRFQKRIQFHSVRHLIDGFLIYLGENYLKKIGRKVISEYLKRRKEYPLPNYDNKKEELILPDYRGSYKYAYEGKTTYYPGVTLES